MMVLRLKKGRVQLFDPARPAEEDLFCIRPNFSELILKGCGQKGGWRRLGLFRRGDLQNPVT
jgi:hypothetical protein